MSKIEDSLVKSLSNNLLKIKVNDKIETNFSSKEIKFGEKIELFFENSKKLVLQTFELPHKYGEADIEFDYLSSDESREDSLRKVEIKKIKIYRWKANGINLFGLTKYLTQVELFLEGKKSISIGFFYLKNGKVEYLATGELSISFNQDIFRSFNNSNLSYSEIEFPP
ncbi:hypothetical protein J8L88_06790, partial [Aquimarina sp. MMG015]|uniref:hypothetical protein n=1 Tax=Aquimarina sp. MMG015 TaxID=2822689 RepID=UPI001B3A4234